MSTFGRTFIAALLILGPLPICAAAKPLHRHKAHVVRRLPGPAYASFYGHSGHYGGRDALRYPPGYGPTSADPYAPYAREDPYSPNAAPGAAIRALALRNQYAPGVTNELAPDNIATATGGPSGGVPGFSSH